MTTLESPRRLVLMRHAKSAWDAPERADHDRSLARRGRLAAVLMAAWLADPEGAPLGGLLDHALISSSQRTRETWDLMRPLLQAAGHAAIAADVRPSLYHAEPPSLWDAISEVPETAPRALVLAHNPGLETFLAEAGVRRRFPTAAIAVFEARAPWAALDASRLRLLAFEEPKSLV